MDIMGLISIRESKKTPGGYYGERLAINGMNEGEADH